MNKRLDTKQVRKLNKFLREKVGFQPVNLPHAQGEFRVTKIQYPKDQYSYWDIKLEVEYKGKVSVSSWTPNPSLRELDDFCYYSSVRRNRMLRHRIESEVFNFMKIFSLSDSRTTSFKIGKITWIK